MSTEETKQPAQSSKQGRLSLTGLLYKAALLTPLVLLLMFHNWILLSSIGFSSGEVKLLILDCVRVNDQHSFLMMVDVYVKHPGGRFRSSYVQLKIWDKLIRIDRSKLRVFIGLLLKSKDLDYLRVAAKLMLESADTEGPIIVENHEQSLKKMLNSDDDKLRFLGALLCKHSLTPDLLNNVRKIVNEDYWFDEGHFHYMWRGTASSILLFHTKELEDELTPPAVASFFLVYGIGEPFTKNDESRRRYKIVLSKGLEYIALEEDKEAYTARKRAAIRVYRTLRFYNEEYEQQFPETKNVIKECLKKFPQSECLSTLNNLYWRNSTPK